MIKVDLLSLTSGAYAEDWSRWRNLLYNLYDALIREISHIGSRGKYVTGNRHVAVKDSLIELTADICHQVKQTQVSQERARFRFAVNHSVFVSEAIQ